MSPDEPPPPPIEPPPDDLPTVLPVDDVPWVRPAPVDLDAPRGGFWAGVGLFAGFEMVQFAFGVPFGVIGAVAGVWREPAFLFSVYAVTSVAAAFVMAYAAYPVNFRRVVAFRGCTPGQFVLAVLLAPALLAPAEGLGNLVEYGLGWQPAARPPFLQQLEEFYAALALLPWPLALVCGCLAPAVGEELFFRGVLGRRLVARYGTAGGVLLTTLLFAVAHVDPARMAATFLLGLVLHAVYLATRSLLPGMGLHAVYNALAIGGTKLAQADGWNVTGSAAGPAAQVLLIGVSLLAAAVVLWTVSRARTRWRLPDGTDWSPGYETAEAPPANLGAVPSSTRPGVPALMAATMSMAGLAVAFGLAADQPAEWRAYHLRERADERLRAGDMDGALAAYDEVLRLTPDDAAALGNRGMIRVYRRDFKGGLADLDTALARRPPFAEWLLYRADARWALGDTDGAIADLDAVLGLESGHADARAKRARARQERAFARSLRGDSDGALRDYDGALADDPNDMAALGNRAMVYVSRRDYARGRADLDRALAAYPDAAVWFSSRGDARWGLNDLDGALADYDAALRLEPGNTYPRVQRGRLLLVRRDYAAALAEFAAAVKDGADATALAADRGRALFRLRRYGEAADELEAAVKRLSEHQSAAYDLAWLRAACPDGALRNGPQAVTLARGLCESTGWAEADPLAALAAAEAECGRFDEAVKRQEDVLRRCGPTSREFHERALALYRGGKPYRLGKDD